MRKQKITVFQQQTILSNNQNPVFNCQVDWQLKLLAQSDTTWKARHTVLETQLKLCKKEKEK